MLLLNEGGEEKQDNIVIKKMWLHPHCWRCPYEKSVHSKAAIIIPLSLALQKTA
jgi:hypothetical protein